MERGTNDAGAAPGERLRVLSEAMHAFADATTDTTRLLDAVAERVGTLLRCSCFVFILSDDASVLEPATLFDADAEVLAVARESLEEPLVLALHPTSRRVVEEREPLLAAALDLEAMRPPATTPGYFALIERIGIHSVLIVPLVARAKALGILVLNRHAGCPVAFDAADVLLARDIAEHAALAISNARALAAETAARAEAEAALEELRATASSEATFRALVEAAPDAVVIVDRQGAIVLVNSETERLFGYDRSELVGRPVEMLVPARARIDHDRVRRAYLADPARRQMGSGLELFGVRKDGREIPVEVSLSPIATPSGVLVKSAIRDITSRKRAETKFRALLESAPDAKVIIDAAGRIAIVNARTEEMFGYRRDELVGQPVEILIPAAARDRHVHHRRGFFADPKARPMGKGLSLRAVRKDGSDFPVEISLGALETEDGLLVLSAIRDVTERVAMEEALRLANAELEAFSYSVAHDLRAPLRAVHSFSQILLEDFGDGDKPLGAEGRDSLLEVHQNAVRMGALIEGLLSLSRVARSELRPALVNLGAAARRVVQQLAAAEPERSVAIEIEPELVARIDPRLADNVLANLLGNAWKFTRERADARIEVGRLPGHAPTFFVRDNGAGFDPRYAGKLFGVFQRLHSTSAYPGNGIGLATVQRIVHRHGGRVWAESQLGAGATFFFSLPP